MKKTVLTLMILVLLCSICACAASALASGSDDFLDTDATLDAYVVVESLGMIVRYPSGIFYEELLTQSRAELKSFGGDAHITVNNGPRIAKGEDTAEGREAYVKMRMSEIVGSLPSGVEAVEIDIHTEERGLEFWYFFALYEDTYGDERVLFYIAGVWTNEYDGLRYRYEFTLDCPLDLFDDYYTLFDRIRLSRADA